MKFSTMFQLVKKDAKNRAIDFFKDYLEAMRQRKIIIQNIKPTSAEMIAPDGKRVKAYILYEQESWEDGIAIYKATIFIKHENQTRAVNSTQFIFHESDYFNIN
ncbi:hypothetical protein [Robertmurraya siralis]|uniref:hypothetical protein n=1 Tax=Robertmurraya siralis TaxID=77777 RepID=UPI0010FA0018|nr:hypothetical protein [Robertmurraya siralis]